MKKLITAICLLSLVLSLAACRESGNIRGTQDGITDPTTLPAGTTAPSAATTPSTGPEDPTEPPAPTGGEKDPTQAPTVDPGQTTGVSYKSNFIGIGCNLASGWRFYTDEEIRQLNQIATDLGGDAYEDALKNAQVRYDMFAVSSNGMDNINVMLEKVDPLKLALLDTGDNFEATIPVLKDTFDSMGYRDISCIIDTLWLGDEELDCLQTTAVIDGVTLYQTIFCIKCEGYLASVTLTSYGQDLTNELLGYFYTL